MKTDIFDNNISPFTVPDSYFDDLLGRIISRVYQEESRRRQKKAGKLIRLTPFYRSLVAAAACILFIFTAARLYTTYVDRQMAATNSTITLDEDLCDWIFTADNSTFLAEALSANDMFKVAEADYSFEDEAIIKFLEKENINLLAIVQSLDFQATSFP